MGLSRLNLYDFIAFFCLMSCLHYTAPVFPHSQEFQYWCDDYEPSSMFDQNRQSILDNISSNMEDNGYYSESNGIDTDTVTVEALCRADMQLEDCQSCISEAVQNIQDNCANSLNGFLWQKWCMIRISNLTISWTEYENETYAFCSNSDYSLPQIPDTQLGNLDTLLNDLSSNASSFGSSNLLMVAAGNISREPVIYSMVQCMPDLNGDECDSCLKMAAEERTTSACSSSDDNNNTIGMAILTPRCFLQYETYPFYNWTRIQQVENMYYNDTASPTAPSPSTQALAPRNSVFRAPSPAGSSSPPSMLVDYLSCGFNWKKIPIAIAAILIF